MMMIALSTRQWLTGIKLQNSYTLRGDKVSMLAYTYPHKPLRNTKVTMCNHQANNPLHVWPDVWSDDLQVLKKHGHTWHRMSFLRPGVIKQHKRCKTHNWYVNNHLFEFIVPALWNLKRTHCSYEVKRENLFPCRKKRVKRSGSYWPLKRKLMIQAIMSHLHATIQSWE